MESQMSSLKKLFEEPRENVYTPISGWQTSITEATGSGISIKSFSNSLDKMVLTPHHLSDEYKFNYFWGKGHWSDGSCWDPSTEQKVKDKACLELCNMKKLLESQGIECWLMSISSTKKGHLSARRFNNVYRDYPDNLVSFIFVDEVTASEFKII